MNEDCNRDHCDDGNCAPDPIRGGLLDDVRRRLTRLRSGVYREDMDGDLTAVLEEFERILNA